MAQVTKSFTAVSSGSGIYVREGALLDYSVSGTFVATIVLERTTNNGGTWETALSLSAAATGVVEAPVAAIYRMRATAYTSGTAVVTIENHEETVETFTSADGTVVLKVTGSGITTPLSRVSRTVQDVEMGLSFDEVKKARITDLVWQPSAESSAVVVADFTTLEVDTSLGDCTGASHAVGSYVYFKGTGGGTSAQNFLRENRIGVFDGSTLGTLVVNKHVLDLNADVDGTLATLVIDQLSDFSGTATWVTAIETQILDPRHVYKTAGGIVATPKVIDTDYTLTPPDSGKAIMFYDATSPASKTVTVPASLPAGFSAVIINGDGTQVIFAASGGNTIFNVSGHTKTAAAAFSRCTIEVLSSGSGGAVILSGNTGA